MISLKDVIKLEITKDEIKGIIKKIFSTQFQKRDNLRERHPNIQFDCILRGYIGELALRKWFNKNEITFQKSNFIKDNDGNMDIDFLYETKNKSYNIEVKTSLIPDFIENRIKEDTIENRIEKAIESCDIKLIKRGNESIQELKGDIHLQIYFADYRKKKDVFLSSDKFGIEINNNKFNMIDDSIDFLTEKIFETIIAKSYMERTFFVAWIDKETLINQINQKPQNNKYWSFKGSNRIFWRCNIKSDAKKPVDLIKYLKNLE